MVCCFWHPADSAPLGGSPILPDAIHGSVEGLSNWEKRFPESVNEKDVWVQNLVEGLSNFGQWTQKKMCLAECCTASTASVHTLHMSKPVITFVLKVLRNGLLRYILYTCPNL